MTCLAAGLLVIGAQSLVAQSTTNSATTPNTQTPAEHKRMTPEQRKELLKMLGLTPAELKGLSREDRQAKIKEAAEKVVTDLKAKQASGTLTTQEQTELEHIEKYLAHGHKKAAPATDNN